MKTYFDIYYKYINIYNINKKNKQNLNKNIPKLIIINKYI